jgi:hypothetical protein
VGAYSYTMKIIFSLSIIISLTLISCSESEINNPYLNFKKENIYITFTISDTNGINKNTFHSGEDFLLQLKIENKSGADLHYVSNGSAIVFYISNQDTVVSSSIDFMAFVLDMSLAVLKNNSNYYREWKAPNSKGRIVENQVIVLEPGFYKAKVYHGSFFNEYHIPQVQDIEFEIVN